MKIFFTFYRRDQKGRRSVFMVKNQKINKKEVTMRKKTSIVLCVLLIFCVLSMVIQAREEEYSCSPSECDGGCTVQGNWEEDPCTELDPCCGYCFWEGHHGVIWLECCFDECPPVY